jgi:TRAP-type uncharacterized transport system fused permease subunit
MEGLRRTGGWGLVLSVLPFTLYPLFADSAWLGPLKGTQSTPEQTSAYHMLSSESLLGIPIQAFAETVIGFLVFGTALMMTGAGMLKSSVLFATSFEIVSVVSLVAPVSSSTKNESGDVAMFGASSVVPEGTFDMSPGFPYSSSALMAK